MKQWYIHATSYECAQKILKEGFTCERQTTWYVSLNDFIYLRKLSMDEDNEFLRDVVYESVHSAQITAALLNSAHRHVCFFLFHLEDEDVEEDYSCEGMNNCYEVTVDRLNAELKNAQCINIENSYIPEYRLVYISSVIDNEYLNLYDFNQYEKTLAECLKYSDEAFGLTEDNFHDNQIVKELRSLLENENYILTKNL